MEKLCKSAKTRPGADCGSGHEVLIAKFRLKLKKVGKTAKVKKVRKVGKPSGFFIHT